MKIKEIRTLRERLSGLNKIDKIITYIEWSYSKNDYYSPSELIDLSLDNEFEIDTPFVKVKKGTIISKGVQIINNTVIDGINISIGNNTILDGAKIFGSNINIGENNLIKGRIIPSNIDVSTGNEIYDISGINNGRLSIGSQNKIYGINIHILGNKQVLIGNSNRLHKGLNINSSFDKGTIIIGHNNTLGKDGGGVITTAYRYNREWWGDVLIGSNVQTTRGAEILGFSMLGWNLGKSEEKILQDSHYLFSKNFWSISI